MTSRIESLKAALFETRDARAPKPRVRRGVFVKVGVRGERFWCRVESVGADGTLRAIVDNDLQKSSWPRGHKLVLQHEHVLETTDATDGLTFHSLVAALGSPREAAVVWHSSRVASGRSRPNSNTLYLLP